jgi:uncharacterized protein YndB with AHSA1/START domain
MSVDIKAPPEKVWPYLVEPEKCKQWFTALKIFEYTSESHEGVGSTCYWKEEASGRIYELNFETTEWVENEVFGYRMTSGDFFKSYDERWEIEKRRKEVVSPSMITLSSPTDPLVKSLAFSLLVTPGKQG